MSLEVQPHLGVASGAECVQGAACMIISMIMMILTITMIMIPIRFKNKNTITSSNMVLARA